MDSEWVLAMTNPPSIFNFYPTQEAAEADAPRANGREWDAFRKGKQYVPLSYTQYKAAERDFYLNTALQPLTEEQYMYYLEVLPPMKWENADGVNRFLMSEFTSGTYTQQYATYRHNGKVTYWGRMVDATDRKTWITAEQCRKALITNE